MNLGSDMAGGAWKEKYKVVERFAATYPEMAVQLVTRPYACVAPGCSKMLGDFSDEAMEVPRCVCAPPGS